MQDVIHKIHVSLHSHLATLCKRKAELRPNTRINGSNKVTLALKKDKDHSRKCTGEIHCVEQDQEFQRFMNVNNQIIQSSLCKQTHSKELETLGSKIYLKLNALIEKTTLQRKLATIRDMLGYLYTKQKVN